MAGERLDGVLRYLRGLASPRPMAEVDSLGPLLDEEINRLSEKNRASIILCYAVAPAVLPAALAGPILKAGALEMVHQAVGNGLVSAEVSALVKEGGQAMFFLRGKVMVAMGALVVLCAGAGLTVPRGADPAPPAGAAVAAPRPKEKAPPAGRLAVLLKEKVSVAKTGYTAVYNENKAGVASSELVYTWSKRLLEAERELNTTRAGEQAALDAHRKRMVELERFQAGFAVGRVRERELSLGRYARTEAEVWLMRAKARK